MRSKQPSAFSDQLSAKTGLFALFTACCLLVVAGCVPAESPTQLQATPGAFVRLDEHVYDAGVFWVAYPAGWRIVKNSITGAPMQVVFVSPDDSMTITASEVPLPEPDAASDIATRNEQITSQHGTTVYMQGHYPVDRTAEFETDWEKVKDSLQ